MIYDFIEIGSCDFDTLIESATNDTYGLTVEPLSFYLDKLPDKKNVKKINCAISNYDGITDFYYVTPDRIEEFGLPQWLRGCSSTFITRAFRHVESQHISHDRVPVKSFETLMRENNVGGIKYLKIDTEGHDAVILRAMLVYCDKNPNVYPTQMMFEFNQVTPCRKDIYNLIREFKKRNYERTTDDPNNVHLIRKSLDDPPGDI